MISLIEQRRSDLAALCHRHRVERLEVFGSAADGTFESDHSDLDFLVNYLPSAEEHIDDAYFGLLHDLEDLFHCKIDLVMERAIRNPYFRAGVNQSRQVVYGA